MKLAKGLDCEGKPRAGNDHLQPHFGDVFEPLALANARVGALSRQKRPRAGRGKGTDLITTDDPCASRGEALADAIGIGLRDKGDDLQLLCGGK